VLRCPRLFRIAICVALLTAACGTGEGDWPNQVERAHQQADLLGGAPSQGGGDVHVRRVIHLLEEAYASAPMSDEARVQWVREDLCARVARLHRQLGQSGQAMTWLERGIAIQAQASVARAELFLQQGELLLELGRREAATEALHRALIINQALMEQALRQEQEP
jgi:tetratricopeptide (TPR) repeat protein